MTENQQARKKLQDELRKLFQFDISDLDFGIYRILNRKKDQIEQFIEKDLLDAVKEGLKEYQQKDVSQLDDIKQQIIENLSDDAFDDQGKLVKYENTKLGKEYLQALEKAEKQQVGADTEKKIYNDLYTFFSRYYDDGDFLTNRRISTRKSKYAVPYNGEEVLLHWANKDQYYIKTGEHFTNYKFEVDGKSVWCKVAKAETEKDNVKESEDRSFVLRTEKPIEESEDELIIWFEYRSITDDEEKKWLEIYNKVESKKLKGVDRQKLCIAYDDWIRNKVSSKWRQMLSVIPKNKDRSFLYYKLNHYTGKNTADYFIHKDLQSFLEQELEYYLKNEVIRVDDFIEDDTEQALDVTLTRARVVRLIGIKIIAFLSHIENFQKKLFEKRKFVVDTHYCFTIDRVPDKLYEDILKNKSQLDQWEEIYKMSEWSGELEWSGEWTKTFLNDHQYLMLDTRYFDEKFKFKLLASFEDLTNELNGLLLNGDNFHGLLLLNKKYSEKIDGIYIDPPYNTKSSEILYKNSFKHSSWLSLLENRIEISKGLLEEKAIYTVTIDDYEIPRLWMLLNQKFGSKNHLGTAVIRINPGGRKSKRKLAAQHEYALFYALNDDVEVNKLPVDPEDKSHTYYQDENGEWYEERNLRKEGKDSFGDEDSNRYFPIYYNPETGRISSKEKLEVEILPIDTNGQKRIWRRGFDDIDQMYESGDIFFKETSYGPQIYFKFKGGVNEETPKSFWQDAKFSASEHGTQRLLNIMGREVFSYPKSPYAVIDCLKVLSSKRDAIYLDFFAGSGTTGEAVMKLNQEDNGSRKYILVEMGQYFQDATLPRIIKNAFTSNWNNAIPLDKDGQSQAFKYHLIESYEDTLNNIDFKNPEDTQEALEFEDYLITYMLDFETQGVSASLLKENALETPFDYKLNIQRGHDTAKEEAVDLVETFHYLIGLWVQTLRRYDHQDRKYVISTGQIRNENSVEDICIIWRNSKDLDLDAEAEWINKEVIGGETFDRIYINGLNKMKEAEPIEITFREKMFEDVV